MTTVEIILFAVGAFLLVVGYRRSDRNKMLAAALLLFASAAIGPFSEGFEQGYADGESRDQSDLPR
jgi:hypothetical protein